MTELVNFLEYLNERKVPYILPLDSDTMKVKAQYPELSIKKEGKFYKANGVIVAKNMITKYL